MIVVNQLDFWLMMISLVLFLFSRLYDTGQPV